MPVERSTWSALSVPWFTPAIFPGALPVSMNHLVLSSVPPEKSSVNAGEGELHISRPVVLRQGDSAKQRQRKKDTSHR